MLRCLLTIIGGVSRNAMPVKRSIWIDWCERDWREADLDAAREACPNKLNFAQLLPEADRLLG